jgi:hypothetical protein
MDQSQAPMGKLDNLAAWTSFVLGTIEAAVSIFKKDLREKLM